MPDGEYYVSIITQIELLSFSGLLVNDELRIRELLEEFHLIALTNNIAESAIRLRKFEKLKLPDAIIAATAQTINAVLLSNDQAFFSIDDLRCQSLSLM